MPPGFSGNLIFAIIARMLCGNHLNYSSIQSGQLRFGKGILCLGVFTDGFSGRIYWIVKGCFFLYTKQEPLGLIATMVVHEHFRLASSEDFQFYHESK